MVRGQEALDELEASVEQQVSDLPESVPLEPPPSTEPPEAPSEAPEEAAAPEPEASPAEAPTEPSPDEGGPVLSDAAVRFIDKYGSIDKGAEAYWEMNNRLAQMGRRIKDLESRPDHPAPTPAPQAATPVPPDVPVVVDEGLRLIEGRKTLLVQRNKTVRQNILALNNEIATTTKDLRYWDRILRNPGANDNVDQARAEANALSTRLAELEANRNGFLEWQDRAADDFDALDREERREKAVQTLLNERVTERKQRDEAEQDAFAVKFYNHAREVARRANVSEADYPSFQKYARMAAYMYLAETPKETQITNVGKFLEGALVQWRRDAVTNARRQMASYTRQKLADTRRTPAQRTPPTPAPPAKEGRAKRPNELLEELRERTEHDVDIAAEEAARAQA